MKKNLSLILLLLVLFMLTACSNQTKVKVTFLSNDTKIDQVSIEKDSKVNPPAEPSIDHKIFLGWFRDKDFKNPFDFNSIITKDITLYAKFEDILYSIYFYSNGGNIIKALRAPYNATIVKPDDPIRPGYKFEGWYDNPKFNGEPYSFTKMPIGDPTLSDNRHFLPNEFPGANYSRGEYKNGEFEYYSEEKLKEIFINNLYTLEGRFRGNTVFFSTYNYTWDYPNNTYTFEYSRTGITYDRQAALYIHENKLGYVLNIEDERFPYYRIEFLEDELLYGYGTHLNCDNSPVTTNPFIFIEHYQQVINRLYRFEFLQGDSIGKYNLRIASYLDYISLYSLLYTESDSFFDNFSPSGHYNTVKVVDANNNPIKSGGYHAIDDKGNFLYDENNNPVRALYTMKPTNNDSPFYSLALYAKWSK